MKDFTDAHADYGEHDRAPQRHHHHKETWKTGGNKICSSIIKFRKLRCACGNPCQTVVFLKFCSFESSRQTIREGEKVVMGEMECNWDEMEQMIMFDDVITSTPPTEYVLLRITDALSFSLHAHPTVVVIKMQLNAPSPPITEIYAHYEELQHLFPLAPIKT